MCKKVIKALCRCGCDDDDGDDHIQNPPPDLSAHVELLVKGVATTW